MLILEREADTAVAQAQFVAAISGRATETILVTIGFQGGNTEADVYWLPALGIWAFFGEPPLEKSPGERYWNVFGVGRPHGMVNIVAEINPPKRGINRQVGGAFAHDPSGHTWVVHRGIFNANGRVPLEFARQNFRWRWDPIQDGNRNTLMMSIAAMDLPDFPQMLRDFVLEVKRFKEIARSRPHES